jgi:ribosomal protein S27E
MVYCNQCGEENSEDSVFCSNCGHKLGESKENTGGKEVLQEMVYVRWNLNKGNKIGTRLYQKILYFTDQNIYIGEGSLIAGLATDLGGIVGLAIENHSLSDREKEAHTINFQEMASNDLDIVVIPYPDIVSLKLEKKTFFKPDPKIKLSTPDTDYEFIVSQKVKYKRYAQSLPQILGDKIEVET